MGASVDVMVQRRMPARGGASKAVRAQAEPSWTAPLSGLNHTQVRREQEVGLAWKWRNRRPSVFSDSRRNTTEGRPDDPKADGQPRQGAGQVSRTVCRAVPQPSRLRLAQHLRAGIAFGPA